MRFSITLALFVVVAVSALPHKQIRHLVPRLRAGSSRIVGGSPAALGQFPYQTTVIYETPEGVFFCAGSLISTDWVLTSAYCTFDAIRFTIDLGIIDLQTPNVQVTASRAFIHPGYVYGRYPDDIGLIRLDASVQFNPNIAPVTLNGVHIGAGQDAIISGWGYTSDSSGNSQFLNWAAVKTIDNAECSGMQTEITDGMICVNSLGPIKAMCYGDGGGPLVLGEGTSALLIGVINFGSSLGCEAGLPSVSARISYYRNWIKEISGL